MPLDPSAGGVLDLGGTSTDMVCLEEGVRETSCSKRQMESTTYETNHHSRSGLTRRGSQAVRVSAEVVEQTV